LPVPRRDLDALETAEEALPLDDESLSMIERGGS
jgi:hypothetical protein